MHKNNFLSKLKETIIEENVDLDLLAANEILILSKLNYKIIHFSVYEISALYLKNIYEDFDPNINYINSEEESVKSINIFQTSMKIYEYGFSQSSINTKFPEHIILLSSIFSALRSEKEYNEFKKLKKILNIRFSDLSSEISVCVDMIETLISNILNESNESNELICGDDNPQEDDLNKENCSFFGSLNLKKIKST
jgi:hypothetical protein